MVSNRLCQIVRRVLWSGLLAAFASRAASTAPAQTFEAARRHWSFQPLRDVAIPAVRQSDRVQTPVDAFLLRRLEDKGLGFAAPADRRTLLRRISFDLTGLPPTSDAMAEFEADTTGDALERCVDRLLASPRYGERWGRHWLDVARYADTKDLVLLYGRDAVRPYAYTYRDYVIRAFNEDMPFHEFVRDQLAADLVEPALPRWRLAALGFLTLGRLFDNNIHDRIDDQIDTVSRGFLGLTVGCARCHDHKYDAVKMADYYGLYGVFASTEQPYVPPLIEDPGSVPGGLEFENRLAQARQELDAHIEAQFAALTETLRQRLGDYLWRAATTKPDLSETTQFGLSLTPDDFRPTLMLRTRRFLEQRVKLEDPVFGPWAAVMQFPDDTFASKDGVKSVPARVAATGAGLRWNRRILDALAAVEFTNRLDVVRVYGQVLRSTYEESKRPTAGSAGLDADQKQLLEIVTGPDGPVWFPKRDTPRHLSRPDADKYGGLVLNLDKLAAHATNAPPARAPVAVDLPQPYEPRIFTRGNPSRPGEAVSRGFLRVLNGGREKPFAHGSGRLELAEAIASPDNPLTARVLVNRVWMHHFGEPLVGSTTDFGARTAPPANPELLDWLAGEFVRSGWSIKHLHRVIVLSAAFQQASSGSSTDASRSVDPDNALLGRFNRRRLDLESMRDALLFVSGRLETRLGGRPEDVAGDPLNRRRTVYGLVDRQNLPGLFRSFDFAVPDQCAERRPRTTVPQQALFAMNAPFVQEQARALVAATTGGDAGQRIRTLFERTLARAPREKELEEARRFIEGASDPGNAAGPDPWEQFAQVLLATNEFLFVD